MSSAANGTSKPDGLSSGGSSIIQMANKLIIRWKKNPFNLTIAVLWRDVYIPIRIKSFKIEYGETTTVTIQFNGKEYSRSMTKYKYMGGSHGDTFPKIENETNYMAVNVKLLSLELFDLPKECNVKNDNIEIPFYVFHQS